MLGCLHVGVDVLHSVERHADDDDDDDEQSSDLEKEWDDDIGGEGAKSPVGGSGLVPRITDSNVKCTDHQASCIYDYSCDYFDHLPGVSDPHGRKADEFSSVA